MKPWIHICKNCWYFHLEGKDKGKCYNCDCPGDVRRKNPDDICDGGGCGANDYGFAPKDQIDRYGVYPDEAEPL